jgi:hypothetical protein
MRYATCAVLSAVLARSCSSRLWAEESHWWWPFGGDDQSNQVPVSTAPPAATPTVAPAESESWFAWPSMPELSWPELPFGSDEATTNPTTPIPTNPNPNLRRRREGIGKAAQMQRNRWAQARQQAATPPTDGSGWEMMTESARRVGESTRNAWDKTVDFVTPGEKSAQPPVAAQPPRESWWSRMRGNSATETEGPRTVTEWMAQERLDP